MQVTIRSTFALGALWLCLPLAAVHAADKEEMVANPLYTYWASHKPESRAVLVEETTFGGEDKKLVPGGVDRKVITYTLLRVTPRAAVVRAVVRETAFLSIVQAAPTQISYPAKIDKAAVETFLFEADAKKGEEEVKVGDKTLACKTLSGTVNSDGAEVTYKVWHSPEVPGGIVKQVRTTREDGKVIAETTITLRTFKKAE